MSVELRPITRENWQAAGRVRVTDEQLPMVSSYQPIAYVVMAKAYLRIAGFEWHPLAVYEGDRIVGVLVMVDEREVRGCFALFNFIIGSEHQGRGLGRAAMLAAIEWARSRGASIRLTVQPSNVPARALYESLGFEYGDPWDGELGMSLGSV